MVCALAGFDPGSVSAAFKAGKLDHVDLETTNAGSPGSRFKKQAVIGK
jgi:hypothetical protein